MSTSTTSKKERPNFHIIENPDIEIREKIKSRIQRGWNINIRELSEKYNICKNSMRRIIRDACDELGVEYESVVKTRGGLPSIKQGDDGLWRIWKINIGGGRSCFGEYPSKWYAKQAFKFFRENGWDKETIEDVMVKVNKEQCFIKNYYRTNTGSFVVVKRIDGEITSFGNYRSVKDCEFVVSELKKVDWDKEELPRIRKELKRR